MRDNYPTEVSDPEAEGLPATADDDSIANDEVETGRWADGPDPAALPSDRPVAIDSYGTTAEEQRTGDSLEHRLAQEEPDVAVDDPLADPGPLGDEAIDEAGAARARLDADVFGESPVSDPDSAVSLYDHGGLGGAGEPVGRLVEPDEGGVTDTEPDSVAYDAGAAGGGASAEERAMHETEPPA